MGPEIAVRIRQADQCQVVTDKVYDHHMAQATDDPLEIKVTRRRHAECYGCGRRGSQERAFTGRLTALNRRPDGSRHTADTLRAELEHQADEWQQTIYWHPACRDDVIQALTQYIDRIDADADRWRKVEIAIWERRDDPSVQKLMADIGLTFSDSGVGVG
jgi:hypothetical protein